MLPNQKSAILRVTTGCIVAVLLLVSVFSLSMTTMTTSNMNANALPVEEGKDDVCNTLSARYNLALCLRSGREPYEGPSISFYWDLLPGRIKRQPTAVLSPDFILKCDNVPDLTTDSEASVSCTVRSVLATGFKHQVDLECVAPSNYGLSCNFSPTSVTPSEGSTERTTLTIRAGNTVADDFKVRVIAKSLVTKENQENEEENSPRPRTITKTVNVDVKVVCAGPQTTQYNLEELDPWPLTAWSLEQAAIKIEARPNHEAALTEWFPPNDITITGHDKQGRVACVDVKVPIKQTWLNWKNKDQVFKADRSAKVEWERFMSGLRVHEQGHIAIVHSGYKDIRLERDGFDNAITEVKGKTDAGAQQIWDEIVAQTQQASNRYDGREPPGTDHGRTEGAKLCPEGMRWDATRLDCIQRRPPAPQPFEGDGTFEGDESITTLQQEPPASPVPSTNQTTTTNETSQDTTADGSEAGGGEVEPVPLPEICDDDVDNDGDTVVDADDIEDCPPVTTVTPDDTTATPEPTIEPS